MGIGAGTAGIIAAGVGAAGSLAAASMSSGKGSGSGGGSQSTTEPWGPQQPYITGAYQDAQNIYNTRTAQGPYTGNYFAGSNGNQTSAINNAVGWANGTGNQIPQNVANTSGALMGMQPWYTNNAAEMATNGVGGTSGLQGILSGYATGGLQAQGANPGLSGALNSAAMNGAGALNGFTQAQQQVVNQSLADPTQGLINSANQYMNSSGVQNAVNSTNAQINQQLHESTVPQLNRTAAMGGALNSSRAGMAEAMANENAAIATGNADAQIQNNAWNTGLSTAAAERNAGLTTGMYAANSGLVDNAGIAQGQQASQIGQGQFNTNAQIGAANSGLNYSLGNANAMLNANGQLGNAIGMGMNGYNQANQAAMGNFALGSGAATYQQQANQADMNNQYAQWQGNNTYNQGVLSNYFGIIGQPAGQATTSSIDAPSNLMGAGLGGAAAGMGLYQNMRGNGSTNPNDSGYYGSSYNYNPVSSGYNGDVNSSGANSLQSMGLYNPLPRNY
jgi:hypothetical protein